MGIRLANQMAMDENRQQIRRINSQASRLPVKERQLLGFERKFNLNNVLYTFLLQRRAEAQIQMASNTPDNELVDPARPTPWPVSPNRNMAFALAFALAIALPTLLLILYDTIDNRITNEEDLKLISSIPVVGHIPRSKESYNTIVLTNPGSRISEAFRSLRTRMEFFTKETSCPLILVTSSISGEGKTFASVNLASAYSLTGKKTLLIGFDLRRPTISKSFKLKNDLGMTHYLIGKNSLKEVIHKTGHPNFDIIPSGPIPPNPGELTSSEKTREMFATLKKEYDFIIVDSAPIGVVSDTYSVASVADAALVLVRFGTTKKSILSAVLSEVQSSGIGGLSLLVNDIKLKGTSYRYAYKYKYGEK